MSERSILLSLYIIIMWRAEFLISCDVWFDWEGPLKIAPFQYFLYQGLYCGLCSWSSSPRSSSCEADQVSWPQAAGGGFSAWSSVICEKDGTQGGWRRQPSWRGGGGSHGQRAPCRTTWRGVQVWCGTTPSTFNLRNCQYRWNNWLLSLYILTISMGRGGCPFTLALSQIVKWQRSSSSSTARQRWRTWRRRNVTFTTSPSTTTTRTTSWTGLRCCNCFF